MIIMKRMVFSLCSEQFVLSIECCADTLSGPLLLYKSRGCPAFTIWSNGQTEFDKSSKIFWKRARSATFWFLWMALPRLRLPHPSRSSKGGYHGRWHQCLADNTLAFMYS